MKKIVLIVVSMVVAGGVVFGVNKYIKTLPVGIKSVQAGRGTMVEYVDASGHVEPDSSDAIFSPVDGEVKKVYVRQGQVLEEDDKVIRIEDYCKIESPMDGSVTDILVSKGVRVKRGQLIAAIADLSSLYVVANVDEADIGRVKVGQWCRIDLDSYPDATVRGRVSYMSMASKRSETGATVFPVKIKVVLIKGAKIRLGMSGDVEIATAIRRNTIKIPVECVEKRAGKSVVFSISRGEAHLRSAILGISTDTECEVLSGVSEGERIAASKIADLKDGSIVKEL